MILFTDYSEFELDEPSELELDEPSELELELDELEPPTPQTVLMYMLRIALGTQSCDISPLTLIE